MKKITTDDFKQAVILDPSWATTLTEPVEITDYCDMRASGITHLSHLLHFTGRDENGNVANFYKCTNLKVARGTFDGFVNFAESGVEAIDPENLISIRPDNYGNAASFARCDNLKIAQGTFHGFVWFDQSGIEEIDPDKLVITQPDRYGNAAYFDCCKNLKVAQGTFPGKVEFSKSAIEKIGKLEFQQRLNIQDCDKLTSIPEKFITTDTVLMDYKLRIQTQNEKKARDLFRQHKQEPSPEI